VVICWRAELYYNFLSKTFGERAFSIWSVGFMILFIARPVTILGLAAANRGTLSVPLWLTGIFSLLIFALGVYLFYSVIKYFGMERALGIDHFEPEVYRNKPFVKQGIFKWSSNSMYLFGLMLLWIPGLLFLSKAALLAALFNHLYIWVHYYFTEEPDMRFIYQLD
jgi:protein-S-isoprenylcysteine O-methyltransferase Ste14